MLQAYDKFFLYLCKKNNSITMKGCQKSSLEGLEVQLQAIKDNRGVLTFSEVNSEIPFPVKRIFWITEIPQGAKRGGHAHMTCKEFLCCVNGSFKLTLKNMHETRTFFLDSSDKAVYIPEGIWCSLEDFAPGTVIMVAASEHYSCEGYIYDYEEYVAVYANTL
jgi:dTDP-4-dehydrorhamnose 3,5-epimerase-like enzyme